MNEVIEKIIEFRDERNWGQFHTPENLIKSINIEAGELLECVQWTNDLNINNVKDELADVMNYCLLLCDKLNLNPEEIILDKIKKNEGKYPVDKARNKSTKYNKL